MILFCLIMIPLVGGVLAWLSAGWNVKACRWISLAAMGLDFALAFIVWARHFWRGVPPIHQAWMAGLDWPWIASWGIHFHLAMDGLSLILVLLTAFLGVMSIAASWTEIEERVGFFHFNLLWVLAGIIGVFLSLDMFLFYFFWEMMLVPMYFLIMIWGHERRIYASIKFFLFTQLSGLLMLLSILGLYVLHGRQTGIYTFDYFQLFGTAMSPRTAFWLASGFFIAFAVKLAAVPVHAWLADAHTAAPTAGSVILAGLMLKTGAYGFLRFLAPLFPLSPEFRWIGMALGVIGILYGALLSFGQTDLKRLVAYTSVSHMGFVLLGIFSGNALALQGAVLVIVCHGLSTGGLFLIAGALQERLHTREMARMGGLWTQAPRMGGAALFFALASLGLPGLGNFIGEFLVLLGTYRVSVPMAASAALGLITSVVYALWLIQRVFYGEPREKWTLRDFGFREMMPVTVMMLLLVWLGLYPQPLFRTVQTPLQGDEHVDAH